MNYRKVKCSDRLPELKDKEQGVSDWVLCYWKDTDDWGETFYDYGNEMWDGNNTPDFWLEPYELPTEEDMKRAIEETGADTAEVDSIIEAITNLLKGEKQ